MAAVAGVAAFRPAKATQGWLDPIMQMLTKLNTTRNLNLDRIKPVWRGLAQNRLVYGFGHAVLGVEDPCASVL